MALDIACPDCTERIRVAESSLGQRVKCAKCEHRFPVHLDFQWQSAVTDTQWHVRDADGLQEGPLPSEEIARRREQGHISVHSQLWRQGWKQWHWADELYRGLPGSRTTRVAATQVPTDTAEAVDEIAALDFIASATNQPADRPATQVTPRVSESEPQHALSATARRALLDGAPWLLFQSVAVFLVAGASSLLACYWFYRAVTNTDPAVTFTATILRWCIVAAASWSVAFPLLTAYKRLNEFLQRDEQRSLTAAMEAQRRLWKTLGFVPLALLVLAAFLLLLGIMTDANLLF